MVQGLINFDIVEAERRKEHGLEMACLSREDLLESARTIAFELANKNGQVTYDDVFKEMMARGLHPERLGSAAGSVFRGDVFQFTGTWRKSSRVTNHARVNRVWELAD